jgi:hypothetical protein
LKNLIPWSRIFFEKLIVPLLVEKFLAFYGTFKFIACSKKHASCPYPESDKSISHPSASPL